MIRKVILTTGLLLVAYSLFIYVFRDHIHRTAQIVEHRNRVKAEEFLFDNGYLADTLVVGSSMSNRLVFDGLPGHVFNLSLEGLAAIDGLTLMMQTNCHPRLLLVEINTLDHSPDSTFTATSADLSQSQLRKYIPFTRLKYQPIGVLKALLRDWHSGPNEVLPETVDTALITKIIRTRLSRSPDIANDARITIPLALARNYIRSFEQNGTKVVFFEMPTDPRIRNTNINRRLRDLVDTTFPSTAYTHIRFPSEFYQTTDGVHLPHWECVRYSHYLAQQLKSLPRPDDNISSSGR